MPGCSLLHLLTGLKATYESYVFDKLPLNLKSRSLGMELGLALSTALGNELGNGLGTLFGFSATCKSHFTVGDDVNESVSLHFFLQVDG